MTFDLQGKGPVVVVEVVRARAVGGLRTLGRLRHPRRRTSWSRVASALLLLTAGCGVSEPTVAAPVAGPGTVARSPRADVPSSPQTTESDLTSVTTVSSREVSATSSVQVVSAASIESDGQIRPGAEGLIESLAAGLGHRGFSDVEVGMQVWVDGFGETVAHNHDTPLIGAALQKLATALVALEVLGPERRFHTIVAAGQHPVEGTVAGDLHVIAGGDPTVTRIGDHSLVRLAAQVRAAGVTRVEGDIVVDVTRHPADRTVEGWEEQYVPLSVGPLSALVVDGNKPDGYGTAYLDDPAAGNGELIRRALLNADIDVTGSVAVRRAPSTRVEIARLTSPPVRALVADILGSGDNLTAELLTREIGLEHRGSATTKAGVTAVDDVLRDLLGPLEGISADGSGLHRGNVRPVSEWWRLLAHVHDSRWRTAFERGLAVGGESGTLESRFLDGPGTGLVRARSGSINEVDTLAGYLTSQDGRSTIFVLVVNGPVGQTTTDALDALVERLAMHPG